MPPQPLDYRARIPDDLAPELATRRWNSNGIASICFFAAWMACCLLAYIAMKFDPAVQKKEEWAGLGEFVFAVCSGLVLVPVGMLFALTSLFLRNCERATSVIGLILNGLCILYWLLLRFGR